MQNPRPTALLTGASAGIGRELARLLAPTHDLILTARREAELNALAAELGVQCQVIPADLADLAGVKHLLDAIQGTTIDVFANNAGFGDVGTFADADPAKLLNMIQVNVAAFTALLSGILPGMKARGRGRILNVGSVAGFQPGPFMAVYYATKSYVNSLSQALSSELVGTGITVTCLCPGPTDTEFASVAGFSAKSGFSLGMRMTSREVAEAGLRAMNRGKPVIVPGWRNRLLIVLQRFVPRTVVIGAVKQMLAKRL
jgi:short-subunit dehydrogenase